MKKKKLYTTQEVADTAGVRRETVIRWCKAGKIPEPDRDRNGWRIFTDLERKRVVDYANKIAPSPARAQRTLALGEKSR